MKFAVQILMGLLLFLPCLAITGEEATEFRTGLKQISDGIGGMRTEFKELKDQAAGTKKNYDDLNTALKEVQKENEELKKHLDKLRKAALEGGTQKILGPGMHVSEGCAKWLAARFVQQCAIAGKLKGGATEELLIKHAIETFGVEQRTALTTSDIPMPTNFGAEVVALVWKYGQARKYATVYPMGTLTTKLPKLGTSPAFGIIAASGTVTEKSPTFSFVTFTELKHGGLIRIPSEIEADSIVALGQFLALYIAREMAKWEDSFLFLADGSGTYNSQSGVAKTADTLTNKIQLATGKTKPSDIVIADLRNLRAKIDAAALGTSAYYMHPTMEAFLASLNSATNLQVYVPMGPNGPTLDGFPIRWVGVMPIYDQSAHVSQYQVNFGDLSYWYIGERKGLDVQTSRDVFFATDEIAMRALERWDMRLMADNSMAVLQLAAS